MDYTTHLDLCCPLASDILMIMRNHLPHVLEQAQGILKEEGIVSYKKMKY